MAMKQSRKPAEKIKKIKPDFLSADNNCCRDKKVLKPHFLFLGTLILVGVILGYLFRDRFLAAIVNGKPVFRHEINNKLIASFGKEMLENLIVERLIKQEAQKKNVVVTSEDLDRESEKVSKTLSGGMKLEDALSMQGMSLDSFREQLKLRLQINKILAGDISVSQEEITKYIKENAKTLVATTEAERKIEAENSLMEQKLSERIQTWIGELLKNAKIKRFIK